MRLRNAFALLFILSGPAIAAEPVVVTKLITSSQTAAGQPIALPQGPVEVTFSTFDIAPGAKLPVHRHPWPRYGYVISGTLTVKNEATGKETDYPPGGVILEMVNLWHYGENRGTEPVHLLVIDQVPPGTPSTELKPN